MLDQCFNHKIRQGGLLTPVPALAHSKFGAGPVIRRSSIYTFGATYTDLDRPLGLQVVEAPKISRQSIHKGGKLSASRNGRLYPPGDTHGTYFC